MFEAVLYAFIFDFYSFFLQAFYGCGYGAEVLFLIVAFQFEVRVCVSCMCKWIGEFCSWAFLMNTGWVSSFHSPITTGICGLMIPAFSPAISPSVFPRNWVWSKLMFVIMDRIGVIMLVLSSLPPNPTSMTAKSTFVLQILKCHHGGQFKERRM